MTGDRQKPDTAAALKGAVKILADRFGLNPESVGMQRIASAVHHRKTACGVEESQAYNRLLETAEEEAEALFEMIVVPETWFFRDIEPFEFLRQYVQHSWLARNRAGVLNVLSAPCSTGEEPYSIAITLTESGLSQNAFSIKAVDISTLAIQKAKKGVYGRNAFRTTDLRFQKKYFTCQGGVFSITDALKKNITFVKANLKAMDILKEENFFDVVFCRNLLIYLDADGKKHLIQTIDRTLKPGGILFLGYAETMIPPREKYAAVDYSKAFAFIKKERLSRGKKYAGAGPDLSAARSTFAAGTPPGRLHRKKPKKKPVITSALHAFSASQEGLFRRARQLADDGFVEEALRLCQRSIAEEGPGAGIFTLMGVIEDIMGNTQRAEQYLEKALYLDPDNVETAILLALVMEKQDKREKAALIRQRADRLRSKNVCNR